MELAAQDLKRIENIFAKNFSIRMISEFDKEKYEFVGLVILEFMPVHKEEVQKFKQDFFKFDFPLGTNVSFYKRGIDLIVTIYNLTMYLYIQFKVENIEERKIKDFMDKYEQKISKTVIFKISVFGDTNLLHKGDGAIFKIQINAHS